MLNAFAGFVAAVLLCMLTPNVALAAPPATPEATVEKIGFVNEDSKLLIVFANPAEGKETEFNAFYDRHMREFMKLPNFVRVQKFHMLKRKGRPDPAFQYLFIFEFKGDQDVSFARIQDWIKKKKIGAPDPNVVAKLVGTNYEAYGAGYRGPVPATKLKTGFVPTDSKLLVVFANPVEGQEAGFETWYDQHIRDFMKFPNYVRVQKFKAVSRKGRPDPAFKYLFLHEFKGDQDASFAQTQQAMKDGRTQMPDPNVVAKVEGSNYEPAGLGYRGKAKE